MYFKKGVVYVNFGGTEEIRFLAARGDKVLVANLKLPGGTKEFERDYFEREFTEKQDVSQIASSIPYVKSKTDPKYFRQAKEYAGN